jgi:hypothetical protein
VPGDAPATAAAARRGAALLLEPARRWRLTPCGYPLGTPAPAAGSSPAASVFVLPSTAGDVADVLTIRNDEREEKGDLTVMSPIIHHTRYFSRLLEPGVVLCGPTVAVRRGDASLISPALEIHPLFRSRPTADGWLIADGPYTIAAGEARGQVGGGCSECPAITLQVLFLPRAGGLPIVAFADTWPMAADAIEAGATRDARVAIADDLLTITAWEAGSDERRGNGDWTGVRHCFEAASATFRECGPRFEAAPPADLRLPPEAPPS